jgi:hypothetical protein
MRLREGQVGQQTGAALQREAGGRRECCFGRKLSARPRRRDACKLC